MAHRLGSASTMRGRDVTLKLPTAAARSAPVVTAWPQRAHSLAAGGLPPAGQAGTHGLRRGFAARRRGLWFWTLKMYPEEVVARFPAIDAYGSGETESEALEMLKESIVDT